MNTLHWACASMLGAGMMILAGCESAESHASMSPGAMAPMDLGGQYDSNFEYLLGKYDIDGDRQISAAEYTRDTAGFERLDKDEDGFIAAADFEGGDGMAQFVAQRSFAGHFQVDDVNDKITLDELNAAISVYDTDADGTVTADEFNTIAADRKVMLPGDDNDRIKRMMPEDPYGAIAGQADENEDGTLASGELVAYFDAASSDGVMTIRNPFGQRNRNRGDNSDDSSEYVEPTDGAMLGEMAPDFYLEPPDGGTPVALSSFRNNLPVALIFGSYT